MKKEILNKRRVLISTQAIAVIFLLSLLGTNLLAQDEKVIKKQYQPPPKPASPDINPTPSIVVSPDENYLIGSSDIIEIKIEDAPELSGVFRLTAKGTFILPGFGEIIAQKKTTDEVAKTVGDKLLQGGYLVNPIVSVSVKQSNSRAFFIQGAIRRPGIYQIEGHPSLLKLITVAGGLADNYGSTAFIIREKKKSLPDTTKEVGETTVVKTSTSADTDAESVSSIEGGDKYELIKANINSLLKGNFAQNVVIQSGDIVHIPQGEIFFVAGEVKAPGSFQLKEGTTLRQAISLAQGITFESNSGQSVIYRENQQTGKREEIKVDVGAIMSGKKEDVPILPNDIVIVPNSKTKTVTKSLLRTLSGGLPYLLGVF